MKKYLLNISCLITAIVMTTSCNSFLEENPKTFLSPKFYFTSEAQVNAAVNGLYIFVDDIFNGDIEIGTQTFIFMEYLPGYATRPLASSSIDLSQAINLNVAENNTRLERIWETCYVSIENCNNVIAGIESMADGIMNKSSKNKRLGEAYFLRAYDYFNLVRLFGPVPISTSVTTSMNQPPKPLSSIEDVYTRIETDLVTARGLMADSPMSSANGFVTLGAVKSLLSSVYITMAGYPLQKGSTYYANAYKEAKEVYSSNQFSIAKNYTELRESVNTNVGEYIWNIQREKDEAGSPVHTALLPYPAPAKAISANSAFGGALAPTQAFYDSFDAADQRKAERAFFYSEYDAQDGSGVVSLNGNFIYKFWDSDAAKTGKSGANYSLIRYADVLLIMAEAKAQEDGGTTTDVDAINAYYEVLKRARPDLEKPTSISVNDVLKERYWELCFEGYTWYDMLRTRKAFNVSTRQIVNLIGYQAPGHTTGQVFEEADLLFPYPLREKRLNPNLVRK